MTRRDTGEYPNRCHELQGGPLRETHVKSVALRAEQIAVCVAGFHLTQAPLLTQEF